MAVTTAEMDSAPQAKEQWFTESLGRGFGAFLGRVTPSRASGGSTFAMRARTVGSIAT
jgi:hypothetical protein